MASWCDDKVDISTHIEHEVHWPSDGLAWIFAASSLGAVQCVHGTDLESIRS